MTTQLSLADQFRRWLYMQDIDLWSFSASGRERKTIRTDVHSKLGEAAADVGMEQAIAELGKPRDVVRDYLTSNPQPGPSWVRGVLVTIGAWAVLMFGSLTFGAGVLEGLLAAGGGTAEVSFLGASMHADADEAAMSVSIAAFSWIWTAILVLAFAVGSRIWRLVRR